MTNERLRADTRVLCYEKIEGVIAPDAGLQPDGTYLVRFDGTREGETAWVHKDRIRPLRILERVQGGFRFQFSPGGSFVTVLRENSPKDAVPYDMMSLPEWITAKHIDREAFVALCFTWLQRNGGVVVHEPKETS